MSEAYATTTHMGNAPLEAGNEMHSYEQGWWLYWSRNARETRLVSSLRDGRTQLEKFSGHVVPRCCTGGVVTWR